MAVAVKQEDPGSSGTASTTLNEDGCSLPASPTSGNLLLFCMAGDKATGALTLSGFTQEHSYSNTSVSIYMAYKVSDGSEQSISPSWANSSAAGNTAWYAELEDTGVSGSTWQVSGTANSGTYSDTAVSSRTSGTTGTITADGLAIAAWGVDSGQSVTGPSYSNSYVEEQENTGASGRGSVFVAKKSVTSGGTTESTLTFSTGTDQIHGCVTVFTKVAEGGGPSTTEQLIHHTQGARWNG